jgi:hypothetical protein
MTRVVIVGELYNADLTIGGGPIVPPGSPPGIWGGPPLYPDQGLPGWQPRPSHPIAPGGRPPGIWGGPPAYPDQGLPGAPPGYWGGVAPPYPDIGGPGGQPHPSHPWVPGRPPGIWGGPPMYPDQGLPPMPTEPPDPPADKPPPEEGGWGFWADISSWVYKPAGAGPKG